jgi:hypothetical protein
LFVEPISTELSSAVSPEYFGFLTISESFHVAANVITGYFYSGTLLAPLQSMEELDSLGVVLSDEISDSIKLAYRLS